MPRGFEVVSSYDGQNLTLPYRTSAHAAGYDFEAGQDFTVPSIWKLPFLKALWQLRHEEKLTDDTKAAAAKALKPLLVPTGIKAYMGDEEVLLLANRSSSPLKKSLILPNGIGVIDADYYNNESNEGEIFFQLMNFSLVDQHIKKGDRIGQGIFVPYLVADDDQAAGKQRTGGFGSSGR